MKSELDLFNDLVQEDVYLTQTKQPTNSFDKFVKNVMKNCESNKGANLQTVLINHTKELQAAAGMMVLSDDEKLVQLFLEHKSVLNALIKDYEQIGKDCDQLALKGAFIDAYQLVIVHLHFCWYLLDIAAENVKPSLKEFIAQTQKFLSVYAKCNSKDKQDKAIKNLTDTFAALLGSVVLNDEDGKMINSDHFLALKHAYTTKVAISKQDMQDETVEIVDDSAEIVKDEPSDEPTAKPVSETAEVKEVDEPADEIAIAPTDEVVKDEPADETVVDTTKTVESKVVKPAKKTRKTKKVEEDFDEVVDKEDEFTSDEIANNEPVLVKKEQPAEPKAVEDNDEDWKDFTF